MGGLFQHRKLCNETPVAYLRRELTFSRDGVSATVLDIAAVRGAIYAAVRNQNQAAGTDYIFCAVILFKNNDRDGFGYKDMDEFMGPCEVDCPDRIMRLLSPVEQIPDACHAAEWRARVADAKRRRGALREMVDRLKPGVIIRLEHEVTFGKAGVTAQEFRFKYFQRRAPVFEPVQRPGFLCRLHDRGLATARIVSSATAAEESNCKATVCFSEQIPKNLAA